MTGTRTRLALALALALALTAALWPASSFAQAAPAGSTGASQHEAHGDHDDGQAKGPPAGDGQAMHDHSAHQQPDVPEGPLIPPITDADRAAAFPDVKDHTVHDDAVHYFVLFDQAELTTGTGRSSGSWDTKGWIGKDIDRLWFRAEGDGDDGRLETAEAHLLFGRAISRWWEVVGGVRQDFRPGPSRTWAAIGLQGLAPYWFDIEATAYVGEAWRTHVRLEAEYELLLTNRLVLQPLVEVEIHGKSDPERGIGAGLSSADAGLRLRYEIRREVAPYVGVVWDRKFFGTADAARAAGERVGGARLALGIRFWM